MAFDSIRTPAGKAESVLGGSVNYFSVSASFFAPVKIVGIVGQDFPKNHLDWLSKRHIDVSGIEVVDGKTFHWVGEYDGNMNEAKTLSTALNVFEHFNPNLSDAHRSSPYVFLANIDPGLQESVLNQINGHRLVAADSMNFWIAGKPDEVKHMLKRVDILSINEGEAYLLSGQKNITRAAEMILDMGPSVVMIKRGEYGASMFTQDGVFLAPAYPVADVVDPTGAGDTFAGAFMGYLASTGIDRTMKEKDPKGFESALRRAVLHGCVMASFTVEDFSLHRLMRLERAEFDARFKSMLGMVSVQ